MARPNVARGSALCGFGALLLACSSAASAPALGHVAGGAALAAAGAVAAPVGSGSSTSDGGAGGASDDTARVWPASLYLPARIRRLANVEYDGSVQALLGTAQAPAADPDFPPDLRRDGFTVNDSQRVDAVIVERLADAADALASEAEQNGTLARLAPCAAADDSTSCAERFITTFGAKAYRRPLVDEEVSALLALYAVGADGASYQDGIAHVLRGLLQSAGFLYVTELGDGQAAADGTLQLTPYEIASSLAYLITSAPPDDELVATALRGALADPSEREAQARRLFAGDPRAQDTVVRVVREWLGIDGIEDSAKDTLIYPQFEALKPSIVAESSDFVRAVAFQSTGNVSELLGARWTVNTGPLGLYQAGASGPIQGSTLIGDRVGILNQAAFLATYAQAHESHPIFRGVAIARRVTCIGLDSPASFNIQVVPPLPDPSETTRERYSMHATDEVCAGCHDTIDPFGFSFEHFDGMGGYRTLDNGKPVDSTVEISVQLGFDGPYADSNQLAAALAESTAVRECFARFMFRAAAGTGDEAATPGEAQFMDVWRATPSAAQGNIVETLISDVTRPAFTVRNTP